MITFGNSLKKIRLQKKITQASLAKRVGITPTYLSAIENNRKEPSLSLLEQMASALNTPIEVILFDSIDLEKIQPNISENDLKLVKLGKELSESIIRSKETS